jgi:hypothetical protein
VVTASRRSLAAERIDISMTAFELTGESRI